MGLVYWCAYNGSKIAAKLFFSFRVNHRERIPRTGGVILAMNHQSYLDPPLAGICCDREIYYLARKSLLDWPILGPLFPKLNVIPVEREGHDMSALKAIIRVVKAGNGTVIFPEGTRTKDGKLQPAQAGLGMIVAKTMAPVVPMRIFGAFEAFPKGGRPRPSRITISVGEPMHFTEADFTGPSREAYQRISERIMVRIASLSASGD